MSPTIIGERMSNDKRDDDRSILGDEQPISATSSTDSGIGISNEVDSEYSDGEEIIDETTAQAINTIPSGCNVFYGTYIDNYNGTTRRRYYFDAYGDLVLTQTTNNATRPTGTECATLSLDHPAKDMVGIVGAAAAAVALWLAVRFVVGRLIR